MFHFCTPENVKKNPDFSDVFTEYGNGTLAWIGLITLASYQSQIHYEHFLYFFAVLQTIYLGIGDFRKIFWGNK